MDSTVKMLCDCIELLAKRMGRSPSTVSRIVTGSGDTIRRLRLMDENGQAKHRISTRRAAAALEKLSQVWPADLPWPAGVPRPSRTKTRRAA